jgi:hypothetical protein
MIANDKSPPHKKPRITNLSLNLRGKSITDDDFNNNGTTTSNCESVLLSSSRLIFTPLAQAWAAHNPWAWSPTGDEINSRSLFEGFSEKGSVRAGIFFSIKRIILSRRPLGVITMNVYILSLVSPTSLQ